MVLKRIGPVSCAKIAGTLYAVIGLFIGAIFSLISMAGLAANAFGESPFAAVFGIGAIILLPVFYGCLGFVGSLVGAWIYNIVAGWVGGVELDLQ